MSRDNTIRTRENLLRRVAERQGMTLRRSPRRDPQAVDYGRWSLTETSTGRPAIPGRTGYTLTEHEVAEALNEVDHP